jgi:dTDP-4-amino-4,6-dideoxygalactose transaminase
LYLSGKKELSGNAATHIKLANNFISGKEKDMQVPLLDLKSQYQAIREEVLAVTREIYDSQHFILGPKVESLEKAIAEYCQTRYAVGVSSGSDALIIALMAADIGPDAIVITTPYTFFATAGAVARVGARLVFADIDPETYNLSAACLQQAIESLSAADRKKLRAVIPVHLYGQCAAMDSILGVAKEHRLLVIEDAAQAIGAEDGHRRAGSLGDFGCFSFFPSKNLGAFGDGGIVTTQSEAWAAKLKILRGHGSQPKYYHKIIGGNFRLDALQAGIIGVKLKYLDQWTAGRQANADAYRRLFQAAGLDGLVQLPAAQQNRHIYNQFVINVPKDRDRLKDFLGQAGIGTEVYYPVPMHLQECFAYLNCREGDFPVSEQAARHTLALPIYPELTADQQAYVVEKIKAFFG